MDKNYCQKSQDEIRKSFIQGTWVSALFFSAMVIIYLFCIPLSEKIFAIIAEFIKKII